MNTIKISVVMSVYNDGQFVTQAVQSILSQTFADFEFVIVDDGSIDDTIAQIETFNDPRIRIIRQQNYGLATALNRGMEDSCGQYIARQDGDDISALDRLENQSDFLDAHPEIGLVGTRSIVIDEVGQEIERKKLPVDNTEIQQALLSPDVGNPIVHGSVMFRRALALQIGGYRQEFKHSQDRDLWLRLAEKTQLANLPMYAYCWRLRSGSVTTAKGEDQRDYGQLARICAEKRRGGQPEPSLEITQVQRTTMRRFFSSLRLSSRENDYILARAIRELARGDRLAGRSHLAQLLKNQPLHVYAWVLWGLSLLPPKTALALWKTLRSGYRKMIWK